MEAKDSASDCLNRAQGRGPSTDNTDHTMGTRFVIDPAWGLPMLAPQHGR